MQHLKVLSKYFYKYKYHLLLGILFVAAGNYFRAWQPQVVREALDYVLAQLKLYNAAGEEEKKMILSALNIALLKFGGLVFLLALVMGVFMYFMRQTIIVMSRLVEYDMRKEIYDHYQALDKSFYRQHNTGDMMARITEDVGKVRMYMGPALLYGINLITLFIMVVYAMVKVDVRLTLYSLLPLPILSLSIYYVSQFVQKRSQAIQSKLSHLTGIAQEVFSGIRVVKSYTQEKAFGKHFAEESEDYKTKNMSLALIEAMFIPLMMVLIGLSTIIVIYVGGLQVFEGSVTTGNIAEFVIYINMLTWPVTAIGWIASIVQQANVSQGRINEFMNYAPDITNTGKYNGEIEGELVFDHVTFTYAATGITALDDVSFTIKPGEKVAIIGRTAAGKSTIADLILRMYDPTEGRILLDGIPLRDFDLKSLRSQIAYVPQDVFLFSDTIETNIKFGAPDSTLGEAEDYARHASVHEDIVSLPDGFQTRIGERGITLSGGQKQRISIARALIRQPHLVILDDSLSAVDTHTEHLIVDFLNKELASKTAIMITHRIVGILEYDKVLVIDQGKIIEQGTHDELVRQQGLYYELWQQQLISSLEEEDIDR
ncbi:MAG: ABC transporter ATP-binding protein/permease [Bacteroidota bacterium]|nr:ABC transporter ATP-binding protein/permease [Bacteroidota bacterium]